VKGVAVTSVDEWVQKLAVQERINRYSDAANRGAWDELEACYAPGAVWEVLEPNPVRLEEPAGIREGVMSFIATADNFIQTVHNTVITLHGDGRASARSTLEEIVRSDGKFDVVIWGLSYDELVELDDGWKFSSRQFRGVYLDVTTMGGQATLRRDELD
jgi:ketosteroid isomerase-like protein